MSYCTNCNGSSELNPGEPCPKCNPRPVEACWSDGCPHFERTLLQPCGLCAAEKGTAPTMTDRQLHNAWRDLGGRWSKDDWIDFYQTLKSFKARVIARSKQVDAETPRQERR